MKKRWTMFTGLIFVYLFSNSFIQEAASQTYVELTLDQPPALLANAGDDTEIDTGSIATLGGSPVSTGGTGTLIYAWEPVQFLDQPALSHPHASPPHTMFFTLKVTDQNGCTANDEIRVTVIEYSGFNDFQDDMELFIYPNPNKGAFTIEITNTLDKEIQLTIINLTGQTVYNAYFNQPGAKIKADIDITNMPRGNYILRLNGVSLNIYKQIILN